MGEESIPEVTDKLAVHVDEEKLQDEIVHPKDGRKHKHIVLFIPGNPGCIEFYSVFLHKLYDKIKTSESAVIGKSLGGFEIHAARRSHLLVDQITYLQEFVEELASGESTPTHQKLRLTLMGHSVGTYIILQFLKKYHAELKNRPERKYEIRGGVLLFPTVIELRESTAGSAAFSVPMLPSLGSGVLWTLANASSLISFGYLTRLIIGCNHPFGKPKGENSEEQTERHRAIRLIAWFLKSWWGLPQARELARDEMHKIVHDDFGPEAWNSGLFLLFAKEDKFISKETREKLMDDHDYETYCKREQKLRELKWGPDPLPWMEVDEKHGLDHIFIAQSNERVATLAAFWVDLIARRRYPEHSMSEQRL